MEKKEKDTKKKLRDHVSTKEILHSVRLVIADYFLLFKEWITDYGKVILPMILLVLVSATVVVSLNAKSKVEAAAEEALSVLEETKAEVQEVKETLFEVDKYPEIIALLKQYYTALEMGDVDSLIDIQSSVTNTEIIRLQKMCEYIDQYTYLSVYTKPGPYQDTFIAYAYTEVVLKGSELAIPGLQAFYICMDDNGNYYINNSELTQEEAAYIDNIAKQADVVDLKNTVNVKYHTQMENNEELSKHWAEISIEIDLAVGEQLALDAKLVAQLEEEENGNKEPETDTNEEEEKVPTITKVKTTDYVNVRKSASATADRIGSANAGEVFVLKEQLLNGWSHIDYNGSDGYIKSEFVTVLEDISTYNTVGTVKATTLLNVRSEASSTASKLGALQEGGTAELIEIQGDWCKIKFNGQIGYVSKEYVQY